MQYELIALDLDDTLLDPDKRISKRNLAAVTAARDAGVHIIIATGRAYAGIGGFTKELGLRDYAIVTGGAAIMGPDGNVVDMQPVSESVTHQVMEWARSRDIYFQAYMDGTFWYETPTQYTSLYEKWNGYRGVHVPDLSERRDLASAKLLFIGTPEETQERRAAMHDAFPDLSLEVSDPRFLEISNPAASKGSALLRLGEQLRVPPGRMIAIGDSPIDRSMIEAAGLGVAVQNAVPEVLEAADLVTASCTEDGVAKVIEEYVLADRPH